MKEDQVIQRFLGNDKLVTHSINESLDKLPPQAIDLEEVILGAAIIERQGCISALEKLTPEDFYKESHKEIFSAIVSLSNAGNPVDMRTVINELRKTGKIELVGGAYYIAELTSKISSSANIEYYCLVIIEKRMLRDMIDFVSRIHQLAYEDTTDAFSLLDELTAFPLKIHDLTKMKGEKHIKEGVEALADNINKRTEDNPEITGLPSGYYGLDKITLGWQNTNLIIIAGRPSMGKTTLALNFLCNAAINFKVPGAFFSLEMSFQELTNKVVAIQSDIPLRHLTSKAFSKNDWNQFLEKTGSLYNAPIYIDDSSSLSILDLRVKARRMFDKYKVRFIIVDYLQLMKGEPHTVKNREQEIASISRGLKQIAKELGIPLLALSQLSRSVETRGGNKVPMLADLRESGAIEQDADIVIFPWRPAYYNILGDENGNYVYGLTKLIIAKHRNGSTEESYISMLAKTSKFINIDSPYTQNVVTTTLPERIKNVDLFDPFKHNDDDDTPF